MRVDVARRNEIDTDSVCICVNNGNWQFMKTFCPGIKRKLSGKPRLQGENEGRGMIRVVIFRAASTMVDIFTASLHDTKLEITLQLEISRVTCVRRTYSIISTCTSCGNEIFTRVAPHCNSKDKEIY